MNIIEQIKAEIERRIELHDSLASNAESEMIANLEIGAAQALDDLLSFLSTLESEKPNQDGLEEEIKRYYDDCDGDCRYAQTARHFAKWGAEHAKIDVTDFCKPIDPGIAQCIADHSWEMLGEDEKSVPNDLEEAAEAEEDRVIEEVEKDDRGCPYISSTHVYNAFVRGAKWDREQMMKEAVECIVEDWNPEPHPEITIPLNPEEFTCGDKVRVIVCKKED